MGSGCFGVKGSTCVGYCIRITIVVADVFFAIELLSVGSPISFYRFMISLSLTMCVEDSFMSHWYLVYDEVQQIITIYKVCDWMQHF